MKNKILLIIVVVIVIAIVILAIIFVGKKGGSEGTSEAEGTSLEGVEIAEEIYGFSAEIKEIKNKTLLLKAWVSLVDTKKDPVRPMVTAIVNEQTKIVRLKLPEIIEDNTEPIYPKETEMSFDELKVGDKIDIGTIENISEKIKNKTEFILSHIFIIE